MNSSTYEYIELVKATSDPKILASLDVESIFTNIPVMETIDKFHPDIFPPKILKEGLRTLLKICTTKTPFRSPNGDIYQQVDGVSMGTPLGQIFANFYASHLEETVFKNDLSMKPPVYCRYMDDIFWC